MNVSGCSYKSNGLAVFITQKTNMQRNMNSISLIIDMLTLENSRSIGVNTFLSIAG